MKKTLNSSLSVSNQFNCLQFNLFETDETESKVTQAKSTNARRQREERSNQGNYHTQESRRHQCRLLQQAGRHTLRKKE